MPELPEVETIVRTLRPGLVGKTILDARLLWKRTLAVPSPRLFSGKIKGQAILDVSRRAKYLDIRLQDLHLIIHLRMSGDLFMVQGDRSPALHDRLIISLSGDSRLVFNDTRKFGRVWLVDDPSTVFAKLGPEPLSDQFTPSWLLNALGARRRQLKSLLLDQSFLAGLGNIYTDEALHIACLHPLLSSAAVDEQHARALWQAIRDVLQEGIRRNGSSIDWVYRGGDFQNQFRVYGRTGEACPVCGTPVERIVVGQRGTHFCPVCQPLPPA